MKNFTFLLGFIFAFVVGLSACGNSDNKIRVAEVTHSIFYAPLYVAANQGFFSEYGLSVEITNVNGSDKVMTSVLANQSDIGLAGPETAIYAARQGQNTPKVFGQLTNCDGSFLLSRNAISNFTIEDLRGKEILAGRQGGMPAMTLQYALHLAGLEANVDYTLNLDISFANMVGAFDGGLGDFCTMFEPTASAYAATGKGHIVASIGQMGGNVPYTAFVATEKFLKEKNDTAEKFLTAVFKGYKFIQTESMDKIIDALLPSFPSTSRLDIQKSIESYKQIMAFASSPVLNETDYNHLQEIVRFAGELDGSVDFSKVVDNSIAKKVAKNLSL